MEPLVEAIRLKARYSRSLKRTRKDLATNNEQQETPKQQHQEQNTARSSIDTLPAPRFEDDGLSNRDTLKIKCKNKNASKFLEKPLLVLDVNGVLCRRIRSQVGDDAKAIVTYRSSLGRVAHTEVVPRTDLHQFLNLLDSNFVLAIWSSAKQKTLKKLIQMLFPSEVSKRLLFVWGQEKCDVIPTPPSTVISANSNDDVMQSTYHRPKEHDDDRIHKNIIFMKSLAKVFYKYPSFNETNTILIDDSPEKCPHAYWKNALHPPSISGIDTKLNRTTFCMNDDDETNQMKQTVFFQQLATFWNSKTEFHYTSNSNELHNFLSREARGHMGWKIEIDSFSANQKNGE